MNLRSADGKGIDGLTVESLIARIISSAVYFKGKYVEMARENKALIECGKYVDAIGYFNESLRFMSAASYIIHPLRDQIASRTLSEKHQSEIIVLEGRAWFLSSSPDDCSDCDYPMRFHIGITSKNYAMGRPPLDYITALCPFGREYWNIARLLEVHQDAPGRCKNLARATASHGASKWRTLQEITF